MEHVQINVHSTLSLSKLHENVHLASSVRWSRCSTYTTYACAPRHLASLQSTHFDAIYEVVVASAFRRHNGGNMKFLLLDEIYIPATSNMVLYEYIGSGQYRITEPYNTIFRIIFVVCLLGTTVLATKRRKEKWQIASIIIMSAIMIFIFGLKLVCYIS